MVLRVAKRGAWLIVAGAFLYGLAYGTAQPAPGPMVSKMQDVPSEPGAAAEQATLDGVETHNCPRPFLDRFDLAAASGGPLRLEMISCGAFGTYGSEPGLPSPDGEKLARWTSDGEHSIQVGSAKGGQLLAFPNPVTFRSFAFSLHDDPTEGFAWTAGSDALWTVRQELMRPSGWALTGLTPIQVGLDGEVRELPRLRGAGRLDGVRWAGAEGLALAQFSTRGGYYRPEQLDADPTLAIIDAARGRVRHSIRLRDLAPLKERIDAGDLHIHDAAATLLPDGRVRAAVELAAWRERPSTGAPAEPVIHPGYLLTWTEGSAPRLRAIEERSRSSVFMAISPAGSHLLVLRKLQPENVIIRECHGGRCSGPPPPPPTPVEGVLAELIDLSNGRSVWQLRARVEQLWRQGPRPAISPDGRIALLSLPPQEGRVMFALVRMRDGAILHRFSITEVGSLPPAFGFLPDGRRAWVTISGTFYRFRIEG
jgi:hypothetical protein